MSDAHALVWPRLEAVSITGETNTAATIDVTLTADGLPVIEDGRERVLGRWMGVASLHVDVDRETRAERVVVTDSIRRGAFHLAVTDSRVVGAFNIAQTGPWGDLQLDADRTALAFTWPYDELTLVTVKARKRSFGRVTVTGCSMQASRPFAVFSVTDALLPLDASWGGPLSPRLDDAAYHQYATQVVEAAARYRLNHGSNVEELLRRVVAGGRINDDLDDGMIAEFAPFEDGEIVGTFFFPTA